MPSTRTRRVVTAAASTTSAAAVSGLTVLGLASYFMRRVVTPEADRADDAVITAVALNAQPPTMTFVADEVSTVPGRYGLWIDGTSTHVRIGGVLAHDAEERRVTREVLGVDFGEPRTGPARWTGAFYAGSPDTSLGLPCERLLIPGELGDLPAWFVPAATPDGRCAILVHGRGALRDECLRALPVLHELGISALVLGYRNDPDAPRSLDGRYGLGLHEWRDVDAAMAYAVAEGAQELSLFGWSMGGAIVLQTLEHSRGADLVRHVVLDGPVVDWADVLRHQASINRLPAPIGVLGRSLLGGKLGRRLVGLHEPLEIGLTDWVTRADRLSHRMLLIHSSNDEFVPHGPSVRLARKRPDLVEFVPWEVAQHCREWNTDPQRWDRVVRQFLDAP